MFKKGLVLFLLLALTVAVMSGCASRDNELAVQEGTGTLKLSFKVEEAGEVSVQSVSEMVQIASFLVTLTDGQETRTKEVAAQGSDGGMAIFEDLNPGTWNVEVVASDSAGYELYRGVQETTIFNNTTTSLDLLLNLVPGNLEVNVTIADDLSPASGQIILKNPLPGEDDLVEDLTISGTTGTASFSNIDAMTWYMQVILYDGGGIEITSETETISVLPGRTTVAGVSVSKPVETGSLSISVIPVYTPSDPSGLEGSVENFSIVLDWPDNPETDITGYAVYRSQGSEGSEELLTDPVITLSQFSDTAVEEGQTYTYRVQAYNSAGLSSDLSSPIEIKFISLWQKEFTAGEFNACVSGSTGNYLVGDDGSGNGYLLNLDAYGNILLEKVYSEAREINDLFKTPAEEFLLAGEGDSGEDWVAKVDSSGNIKWEKSFGGDVIYSICEGADGGYLFAGSKNYNGFVVKTDIFGNVEWTNISNQPAFFKEVKQFSDGSYLLLGESHIVKIDNTGNISWNTSLENVTDLCAAASTPDGGFLLVGNNDTGTGLEGCLIKIDGEGNTVWMNNLGEDLQAILPVSDGNYLVAGSDEFQYSYAAKIDANGNIIWHNAFTVVKEYLLNAALETESGGYIFCGSTPGGNGYAVKADESGRSGDLIQN